MVKEGFWDLVVVWNLKPGVSLVLGSWRLELFSHSTFSHLANLADFRTASQTYCVSSASRKVGLAGLPLATPSRKSATWCTKLCSYPICSPGTHHFPMYG